MSQVGCGSEALKIQRAGGKNRPRTSSGRKLHRRECPQAHQQRWRGPDETVAAPLLSEVRHERPALRPPASPGRADGRQAPGTALEHRSTCPSNGWTPPTLGEYRLESSPTGATRIPDPRSIPPPGWSRDERRTG